jgi:predicted DsbA family dithiol-disulfide isomerase
MARLVLPVSQRDHVRGHALADEDLLANAQRLGLDVPRFVRDLATHAFASRVHEDFLSGVRSGVNGTPTFFVNGRRHEGAWDADSLTEALVIAAGLRAA